MSSFRPLRSLFLLLTLPLMLLVTGCGVGPLATGSSGELDIRGDVHGGQQPVSFSNIYLYAAGTGGNGSLSHSILNLPVMSDAFGNFVLTAHYTCVNSEDQVYLVAQGGNPGLTLGTNNAALIMINALGRCGDLPGTQYVSLNELTTVAAVWALTPFITDYADIGSGSSAAAVAGLKNGFLNAHLLVSSIDGRPAVLPANLSVESAKLNSLANSLASCANSDGTTGCNALFAAATPNNGTGTPPTNLLQAALNIVRNPSNQVGAVYAATSAILPFAPTLPKAPNDWTMSLKVTGGGLTSPEALKLDAEGNVWVVNYNGGISGFSPQGTPFSASGYAEGGSNEWYDLAIDSYDDIWATIEEQPSHSGTSGCILRFYGVQTAAQTGNSLGNYYPVSSNGSEPVYDLTVQFPESLAADTNDLVPGSTSAAIYKGNLEVANEGNSRAEIFDHTGATVIDNLAANYAQSPVAIAVDANHGAWIANQGGGTVTHVGVDGTILSNASCCSGTDGIAVDSSGNAWVSDYYASAAREITTAGVTAATVTGGGISGPARIFVDANQDVWVADFRANAFTHIAGNGGTTAVGTLYSPSKGNGLDAGLLQPFGISVDATGNLWMSSAGTGQGVTVAITMFFGVAAPTKTPLMPVPSAP